MWFARFYPNSETLCFAKNTIFASFSHSINRNLAKKLFWEFSPRTAIFIYISFKASKPRTITIKEKLLTSDANKLKITLFWVLNPSASGCYVFVTPTLIPDFHWLPLDLFCWILSYIPKIFCSFRRSMSNPNKIPNTIFFNSENPLNKNMVD